MARASETMQQEAIARGVELFALHCASCHGEGGEGGTGPPLKTIEFLTQNSDEDIFRIIARGQGSMMPAWSQEEGGPLAGQQIEALVALLRSWEAKALPLPTPTPLVGDGATLWARFCAGCHGPDGRGTPDVELKLNSRRFLLLNDDEAIRQVVVEGRPDRGMPVFGDLLSAAEIDALVSFVREWEAGAPRRELGGATLFARYCAFCHGASGEGGRDPNNPGRVVPPLNSVEYLSAKDDQFLREVILEGRPEVGMPPWRDVLTDAELSRLIAFMRGWQVSPAELSGEELFARYCAACHGSAGEGGPNPFNPEQIIVSLNSPEYLESHDDSSLRELI
ncbi:MAG: c-type cytochrome, partial [Anaerolineae bacterium]